MDYQYEKREVKVENKGINKILIKKKEKEKS